MACSIGLISGHPNSNNLSRALLASASSLGTSAMEKTVEYGSSGKSEREKQSERGRKRKE